MTKQPHLKDRIRARMADTGESYMTARRHVVGPVERAAARPAPASRWRHWPGVHPQTTVVRTLLGNHGLEVSEALALGLSGGVRLNVYESRYEAEDYASLYVTPRPLSDDLPFVTEPLERAGARVVVDRPGVREADAALRSALDAGPVAVWLDLAEAGYAGLPAPFSGGAYHVVSVLDHDGTSVTLSDVADEPIALEATRLTAARGRIRKYKARTVRVTGAVDRTPHVQLVRRAVDASLAGIAGPPRGSGPAALDRLVAAMRDQDRARAWSVRFRPGPNLARALTGLYRFVEAWGTGGGFLRPLFADFLDEAATTLDEPGLRDAAAAYRTAGRVWTALAEAATPDTIPPLAAFRELEAERADARARGALAPEQGAALADGLTAAEAEAAAWLAARPSDAMALVNELAGDVLGVAAREREAEHAFTRAATSLAAGSR